MLNKIDVDKAIKDKINELFGVDWKEQYERMQNEHKTKIK